MGRARVRAGITRQAASGRPRRCADARGTNGHGVRTPRQPHRCAGGSRRGCASALRGIPPRRAPPAPSPRETVANARVALTRTDIRAPRAAGPPRGQGSREGSTPRGAPPRPSREARDKRARVPTRIHWPKLEMCVPRRAPITVVRGARAQQGHPQEKRGPRPIPGADRGLRGKNVTHRRCGFEISPPAGLCGAAGSQRISSFVNAQAGAKRLIRGLAGHSGKH